MGCGKPSPDRKKREVSEEPVSPLEAISGRTEREAQQPDGDQVRRAISGEPHNINKYNSDRSGRKKGRHNKGNTMIGGNRGGEQITSPGANLDRLVKDIRVQINNTKDIWKNLPHAICSSAAAPVYESNNCWNGLSRARFVN